MTENKESFYNRIKPFLSQTEELRVKLAYYLAKYGHRGQVRKELLNGEPMRYFEHVRRVAINLMDEAHCYDPNMIVAALLHDSLEDTQDLTAELLEFTFGEEVCRIVKQLSKVPKEGYMERLMVCTDWRVLMIKACDRLDNVRSLIVPGVNISFQKRQIQETKEKYLPLLDRLIEMAPSLYLKQSQNIRDEVIKAVERCTILIELKEKELPAEPF